MGMIMRCILLSCLATLSFLGWGQAQEHVIAGTPKPTSFVIAPSMLWQTGSSDYDFNLNFSDNSSSPPARYHLRSLLEYPMDAFLSGLTLEYTMGERPSPVWRARLKYLTNISNPSGKMVDSDFLNQVRFSYTESRARLRSTLVEIDVSRSLFYYRHYAMSLTAGIRYFQTSQRIIGYDGYQLSYDPVSGEWGPAIPISRQDGEVLTYDAKFVLPQVGFTHQLRYGDRFSAEVQTMFALAYASDLDDHVLRHFTAAGSGSGYAMAMKPSLRYDLFPAHGTFIDFEAEYMFLATENEHRQEWYGDDPASPDLDDTGQRSEPLPHRIKTSIFAIGIRLSFAL